MRASAESTMGSAAAAAKRWPLFKLLEENLDGNRGHPWFSHADMVVFAIYGSQGAVGVAEMREHLKRSDISESEFGVREGFYVGSRGGFDDGAQEGFVCVMV
jgi:hypothetical protein